MEPAFERFVRPKLRLHLAGTVVARTLNCVTT
jgi:hypothetical protein